MESNPFVSGKLTVLVVKVGIGQVLHLVPTAVVTLTTETLLCDTASPSEGAAPVPRGTRHLLRNGLDKVPAPLQALLPNIMLPTLDVQDCQNVGERNDFPVSVVGDDLPVLWRSRANGGPPT